MLPHPIGTFITFIAPGDIGKCPCGYCRIDAVVPMLVLQPTTKIYINKTDGYGIR